MIDDNNIMELIVSNYILKTLDEYTNNGFIIIKNGIAVIFESYIENIAKIFTESNDFCFRVTNQTIKKLEIKPIILISKKNLSNIDESTKEMYFLLKEIMNELKQEAISANNWAKACEYRVLEKDVLKIIDDWTLKKRLTNA